MGYYTIFTQYYIGRRQKQVWTDIKVQKTIPKLNMISQISDRIFDEQKKVSDLGKEERGGQALNRNVHPLIGRRPCQR